MSRCQLLCTSEALQTLARFVKNQPYRSSLFSVLEFPSGPLYADEHECEHVQVYFDPSSRVESPPQRARSWQPRSS